MDMPFDEADWVKARVNGSARAAFFRLLAGLRKDVATRNAHRKPGDAFKLEIVESKDGVTIARHDGGSPKQVRFTHGDGRIEAVGDGVRLRATLTLNGHGQCRLNLDGTPTEDWRFRQLALETLFFGE